MAVDVTPGVSSSRFRATPRSVGGREERRFRRATRLWLRTLPRVVGEPDFLDSLGAALARAGRPAAASGCWHEAAHRLEKAGLELRAADLVRRLLRLDSRYREEAGRLASLYELHEKRRDRRRQLEREGDRALRDGRIDDAAEAYGRLLDFDPTDLNAHVAHAHALAVAGRPQMASSVLLALARRLVSAGHPAAAEPLLERLKRGVESDPLCRSEIRRLEQEIARRETTRRLLEAALVADAPGLTALARLRRLDRRFAERLRDEKTLVNDGRADRRRIRELIARGDVARAFDLAMPWAEELNRRGRPLRAVAALAPLLRRDPGHVEALKASLRFYRSAWRQRPRRSPSN